MNKLLQLRNIGLRRGRG